MTSSAISKLSVADCHLGPMGLTTLAKFIPDSTAMTEIRLDGNPITGSRYKLVNGYRAKKWGVDEYDCDPSGFVALLEAMKSSAVAKLSIADCDIGPKGLMTSAPLISVITAASEVNLSKNKCFGS